MEALIWLRLIFGATFVLFVPGFAWSFIFLPRVGWIERIAFSFGLSLAMGPLAFFWLNRVFGVQLTLLNSSAVIILLSLVPAAYFLATKPSLRGTAWDKMKSLLGSVRGRRPDQGGQE